MKKIIALLLALTMLAAFAGCDNTPDPTDPPVTVMTYAEYAAAAMEAEVVVETTIQAYESWWDGVVQLYCQSADGAYYVYKLACSEEEAAALVPGTVIRVSGYKSAWEGEVEIIDATYEIIEGTPFTATAIDYTALLGTEELLEHQNELASLKGLKVVASEDGEGKTAAYLYKYDGSGQQGDDLYFNVEFNGAVYTFTVNAYMNGTGSDSDVYKAIEALQIGDVIDVEGFLYWYNAVQLHTTSVKKAG